MPGKGAATLVLGALSICLSVSEEHSVARASEPTVDAASCRQAFALSSGAADSARAQITACLTRCQEVLDRPLPNDPMFETCRNERLHPNPQAPPWVKL
jgi:hypothetical protein